MSRLRATTLLVLTLGSALLAGCAGSDGPASTPVAGSHSAYCKAYRSWKVYELDGGGAFDQTSANALRAWWNAYVTAEETMLEEAPPEIRSAVEVKVARIRTVLTPLLEKYEFDLSEMREASPSEQAAFFGLPPAEVAKAQEVQYAYEDKACGMAPTPPAANVVFEPDASSKAYCAVLDAFDIELGEVAESRFDPDVFHALVAGDRFPEILDRLDVTAPDAIAANVRADTEWFRTRWSDVVAQYGYDVRRIFLDATPEDLAVFNRTHSDVLQHTSRTTAYEDQVCMR